VSTAAMRSVPASVPLSVRSQGGRAPVHTLRRMCTRPPPRPSVRLPPPRPLLHPRNRWPAPPRSGTKRGPAFSEPGRRLAQHEACQKAPSSARRNTARPHGARLPSFATRMLPWPCPPVLGPGSRPLSAASQSSQMATKTKEPNLKYRGSEAGET